ncbi:MAG TPA: DUF2092 domain-containing protein [Vicinamibacterales bacterium]|jgi:hypothetical protein
MSAGRVFSTVAIGVLAAGCTPKPLTPEEARAKGDALLRQMSQTLAETRTFSYSAEETRERVQPDGTKTEDHFTRRVTLRRPDAVTFSDEGAAHDLAAWYSNSRLTLVSNHAKAWARGPMPSTLDEALDFVSSEYAIQLPTADLLYSSPYDALMTTDTSGGWVGAETIDGTACDHLSYSQALVNWELWLTQDDRHLPRQARITYKMDTGQPVTRVVFRDWNPAPQISDATFTPTVPDGYRRIKIMRYATVETPADAPSPGATTK